MIHMVNNRTIYLACGSTDLRKAINGLSTIVQQHFQLDPFSHSMFVFCNKHKNLIKILEWEHSGFWLHTKRLEKGHFTFWPQKGEDIMKVTERELNWLLEGLSLQQPQAHQEVLERNLY